MSLATRLLGGTQSAVDRSVCNNRMTEPPAYMAGAAFCKGPEAHFHRFLFRRELTVGKCSIRSALPTISMAASPTIIIAVSPSVRWGTCPSSTNQACTSSQGISQAHFVCALFESMARERHPTPSGCCVCAGMYAPTLDAQPLDADSPAVSPSVGGWRSQQGAGRV